MPGSKKAKHQSPDSCKIIFLTGMPAAGKTYWAEKVAKNYGFQFIDLDGFIEQEERASIPALFATYGEGGFREREHKYLAQLIKSADEDTVIACGGGTPCFNENSKLMKETGIVIYLQAQIATLLEHIKSSEEKIRPLLRGRGDMATYLEGLLQKRKNFYEQAQYILPVENISLTTFREIIKS